MMNILIQKVSSMTKNNIDKNFISKATLSYFFYIFLIFGSILSGVIGVLYSLESKDYLKSVELEEEVNLKLQLKVVTNIFESIASDILFLSKQNELLSLVNNDDDDNEKYTALISNEYLELCRNKKNYDQIRYLDETGMEVVRVNYNNGTPKSVEKKDLQPKGNRYYFKDTFALDRNEIFVSPLDLNVERGEIEKPLKPMIRFGVPIFNNKNKKCGAIIINYLASTLIASIKEAGTLSLGDIMLVNSEGYWLCSPIPDDEWGFMMKNRRDRKFSATFPDAWNKILSSDTCQIHNPNGLFTSTTIYPLQEGLKSSSGSALASGESQNQVSSSEYFWKIVSHVPKQDLNSGTRGLLIKLFFMAILLFLLAAIPSWIIAKAIVKRKVHQAELTRYWNHLEGLVKERTDELEKAKKTAEASNKAKSEFLANVSHELKTPLNAILGYSQYLSNKLKDPDTGQYLKKIEFSTNNLRLIIDDLLTMSQMKSSFRKSDDAPLNVNNFLNHLANIVSIEVENKSLDFTLTIGSDVPDVLVLCEVRLRHVLLNLLSNAIKFTHKGSIKMTAFTKNFDATRKILDLHIRIEDTGIGITEAFSGKVFDQFQQQDGSRTREFGGLGLGLAVAQRLAQLMGGTITVKSEINKGSVFEVTLKEIQISETALPLEQDPVKEKAILAEAKSVDSKIAEKQLGNNQNLMELLRELAFHIAKKKPRPCKEILQQIEAFTWPDHIAEDISQLNKLIQKYKYKDAEPLIGALLKKIES